MQKLSDNPTLKAIRNSIREDAKRKDRENRNKAKRYAPIPTIQNARVIRLSPRKENK